MWIFHNATNQPSRSIQSSAFNKGLGVVAASFHPFLGAPTALVDQKQRSAEALEPPTGLAHGASGMVQHVASLGFNGI